MKIHTACNGMHPLRLSHEAVKPGHVVDCSLRPAVCLHDGLYFFAQCGDVIKVGSQIVQCVSEGLVHVKNETERMVTEHSRYWMCEYPQS